jgi:hypothetical protein
MKISKNVQAHTCISNWWLHPQPLSRLSRRETAVPGGLFTLPDFGLWNRIIASSGGISSTTQRGFSSASVLSAKRRNNRRRALARTSGAEMWHGQNSPTTSPAWRKWMAALSLCHVNLTESNRRTVWSYKIAGTAAP